MNSILKEEVLSDSDPEESIDRASDICRVAELRNSGKSRKSHKIYKNMKNTVKFSRNLIKYMSVQHI